MTKKAKLVLILKAGNTVIAEVENPILWQEVLAAINRESGAQSVASSSDSLSNFAKGIGVTVQQLRGALGPTKEEPYLHLNKHSWAAMKKNTPKRGPGALNPTALAGTFLTLWLEEAEIKTPVTLAMALKVLKHSGIPAHNPTRGIKNTPWLLHRSGGIIMINPAQINEAQNLAADNA